jgi:hypothetical protein
MFSKAVFSKAVFSKAVPPPFRRGPDPSLPVARLSSFVMILTTLFLGAAAGVASPAPATPFDVLALRVGRAETIANGTIENAVILIQGSTIVAVGEDLPIERGIRVIDLPDAVVMPGLINCRTRIGLDSRAGTVSAPQVVAADELVASDEVYGELLELGVTTIAIYPPGAGIPGQASALRTGGHDREEMVIEEGAYLAMFLTADRNAKKVVRDAFGKVDEYLEKVDKAREKWTKDQDKKKKKDDDKDKEDGEKAAEGDGFEPPTPDPEVLPLLALRTQDLRAQFSIRKAADLLHLFDVLAEEDQVQYDVHIPLRDDIDLFYVLDRVAERKLRIICDPVIVAHPGTRRDRNLPAEIVAAGGQLALLPRNPNSVQSHRDWLGDVARLVTFGLDRQAALRAVTLEPALAIGLGERLGSIEVGKDANLLIFDGDPFEPSTTLDTVLLEGRVVHGEFQQ